jgi:hypothetical protein
MQRTSRWRNALLTWKRKLPTWLRFWLATRWRQKAVMHTRKVQGHLDEATQLRIDALTIEPSDKPTGDDE